MVHVSLWDMRGAGLIIPLPTAVIFSNQVGGGACLQRSLEGIFVPIDQESQLGDHVHSLETRLADIFQGVVAVGDSQVDEMNALLSASELTKFVVVDKSRVTESCEAWVHVIVSESEFSPIRGMPQFGAVLTWPNSD